MLIFSHYAGHDPAVCILKDGEVLLNLERERVSRIRHDIGMTQDFIEFCLDQADVTMDQIEILATKRDDPSDQMNEITPLFGDDPNNGYRFERILGRRIVPEIRVHHHLAHAASALYTSPFEDAVLLTWDGGGDDANTSIGLAKDGRIRRWKPTNNANIASWYRFIGLCNFGMQPSSSSDLGSQAGKVMALAAFGKHDPGIMAQLQGEIALFPYTGGFNAGEDLSDTKAARAQALAAALQSITEDYLTQLFQRAYLWGDGVPNLCFAGGVALNCVANTKALNASGFDNIHIPPCSNDGGLALGQALFIHHHLNRTPYKPRHFPSYHGPSYSRETIKAAILQADLRTYGVTVRDVGSEDLLKLLCAGEVIALFKGKSESGPRALGHRSIVCRPDSAETRDFLNHDVKQREWFRPFAPIVLAELCDIVFEGNFPHSPYMATTAVIRPEWRERMAAVCHVDNTTRPQVLVEEHEPWLYSLISAFHKETGIPAILNTSFNRREPIVETPAEAIRTYLETPLKYLYLDGLLLERT